MSLFSRWSGRNEAPKLDQAVLIHVPLSNDEFGSDEEQEAAFDLESQLEAAINQSGVGEFDGNEFGGGECVLYIYGPDADRLFAVVEPILKAAPVAAGGFAIKRYGEASDENAREVRVTWRGP